MDKIINAILFLLFPGIICAQSFTGHGIGGGGAFYCPSINPANPQELYVVSDMSGVYHSFSYGHQWESLDFRDLQAHSFSMIRFTSDPQIRYALGNNERMQPMRSADGGLSWNPLPGNPNDYEMLYSLNVDYNNPQRLFISDYSNIYYSSNSGQSFTMIHTTGHPGEGALVAGAFFDGSDIFLATNDGLLVSHNAGGSFAIENIAGIPADERMLSFAAAREGDTTRFFCLTIDSLNTYVGLTGTDYYDIMRGVYALDYGTGTWQSRLTGINVGTDYPMWVGMAENDINTVYLAGGSPNEIPVILKSTSAGALWFHTLITANNQNIYTGYAGSGGDMGWWYGGAPLGFAVSRNDASRLVFTDLGFVHTTSDGGLTWHQAYVDSADQHAPGSLTPKYQYYQGIGLENTTCWQVLWPDSNQVFAAFSDIRGIRSVDGGQHWSFDYSGHSQNTMYWMEQHPQTGILYAATSTIHDMYQSTRLADNILDNSNALGKVIYSTNNGASWTDLHNFQHPVYYLALDPGNPDRMYASVINHSQNLGGIWKSENIQAGSGSVWTKLPNPPRTEGHPAVVKVLNDGKVLCSFSGRRASNGAFTQSSGVFLYDPATQTWSDRSHPGMTYWTQDVIVDPADTTQNTWYACVFSGWGGPPNGLGGLYRTYNRGLNWTRICDLDRVMSAAFNPGFPHELYISTETEGVWVSYKPQESNPVFEQLETYTFRQPLRFFFNPDNTSNMWVTSFGHAMAETMLPVRTVMAGFTANPKTGSYPLTVSFSDQSFTCDTTTILSRQWDFNNDGMIDDTALNPQYTYANPGVYSVSLIVNDGYHSDTAIRSNYIHVGYPPLVYVDQRNTTGNRLGTNLYPYTTIQMAVDSAESGDTILVAAGNYAETLIINGKVLHLKGSYAGGSTDDYVSGIGGNFTIRDTALYASHIIGTPATTVLTFIQHTTSGSSVNGFHIRNGRRGIVLDIAQTWPHLDSIRITNNCIEHNGAAALTGVSGVGIQAYGGNHLISNNIIRYNQGGIGAGIYASGEDITISNNLIEYNTGWDYVAGGMYFSAGGEISHNVIRHNTGAQGVSWGYCGGLMISSDDTVRLSWNEFSYNHAPSHAAAILIDYHATVYMDHDLIFKNSSSYGAGIYVNGASWANPPLRSQLFMNHVTITGNSGPSGYGGNAVILNDADAFIENSIMWGNGDEFQVFGSQDSLEMRFCLSNESYPGTTILNVDPLFAGVAEDDYHLQSTAGRWSRVQQAWVTDPADSPAIDAGDTLADYSFEPFYNGSRLNLGVYGNTAEASKSHNPNGNRIQGNLTYANPAATALDGVLVRMMSGNLQLAETTTDINGYFEFSNLPDSNAVLQFVTADPWTGVNAADALQILQHFVNISPLTGIRLRAADPDNNQLVNSVDALLTAKRFVGMINAFPAGDWVFESPQISLGGGILVIVNAKALCIGDVNASGP